MLSSPLTLGFTAGFFLSIPPDSASLEAINRGINRGFLSSFLVGCGAVIGDALCYGAIILGFQFYMDRYPFLKLYIVLMCFIFMTMAGLYYLLGSASVHALIRGKARFFVNWFKNPFLFGLLSTLLTPGTLVLIAPFFGILAGQGKFIEVYELLAGFVFGGILWSILLAVLSARIGRRIGFQFKKLFSKTAGFFYFLSGLIGVCMLLLEMFRTH